MYWGSRCSMGSGEISTFSLTFTFAIAFTFSFVFTLTFIFTYPLPFFPLDSNHQFYFHPDPHIYFFTFTILTASPRPASFTSSINSTVNCNYDSEKNTENLTWLWMRFREKLIRFCIKYLESFMWIMTLYDSHTTYKIVDS